MAGAKGSRREMIGSGERDGAGEGRAGWLGGLEGARKRGRHDEHSHGACSVASGVSGVEREIPRGRKPNNGYLYLLRGTPCNGPARSRCCYVHTYR